MTNSWTDLVDPKLYGEEPKQPTPAAGPIGNTMSKSPAATGFAPVGTVQPPRGDDLIGVGVDVLKQAASGNAPIGENLYNRTMSKFGGLQSAAVGAAKQEAKQAGYSQEAIGSVVQRQQASAEGERSKLLGDIAAQNQQTAIGAAGNLTSIGSNLKNQEFAETKYADSKKQDDWNRALMYYDPTTPEGLKTLQDMYVAAFGGKAPDMKQLISEREYASKKREQDITSGDLSIKAQELGVSTSQLNAAIAAINSGADISLISSMLGVELSPEQFDSLKTEYSQKIKGNELALKAKEFGLTVDQLNAAIAAINSGADIDTVNGTLGTNLTQGQFNSIRAEYARKLSQQDIALDAAKFGLDQAKMSAIVQAINSGASLNLVNKAFGADLNQDDFDGLVTKYKQEVTAADIDLDAKRLGVTASKMNAIIQAINSGADLGLVNATFGTAWTKEQFDGVAAKYRQEFEMTDLTIKTVKQKIGEEKFEAIRRRIAAGVDLESINEEFGENFTQEQYDKMYQASDLYFKNIAQKNWEETFGLQKVQYADSKAWKEFEAAAMYGSPENAASAYLAATGKVLDPQVIRTQRAMNELDLDAKQIANDAAKFGLDNQKIMALVYMANNGFDLETVNARLGTNLSPREYDQVKRDYAYSGKMQELQYATANTQVQVLKASLGKDAYAAMQSDIEAGVPAEEIRKRDYNGDGQPDWPDLTDAAYNGVSRERTLRIAAAEANLASMKQKMGNEAYNQLLDEIDRGVPLSEIRARDYNGDGQPDYAYLTEATFKSISQDRTLKIESAQANLSNMRLSMGERAYNMLIEDLDRGVSIETVLTKDYDGDGEPDFPYLSQEDYYNMGLEARLKRQATTQNMTLVAFSQMGADIKNGMSLDMIQQKDYNGDGQPDFPNLSQADMDGIDREYRDQKARQQWSDSLEIYDPSTPEGLATLQDLWDNLYPGMPTPDMAQLVEERKQAIQDARTANIANAGKTVEALLGDLVDNAGDDLYENFEASQALQMAKENQAIRQAVATLIGAKDDGVDSWKVDGAIENRLRTAIKGDVDILVDDMVRNGRVPEDFQDAPGWKGQLKRSIQDLLNAGMIDKDGNLIDGASGAFPWNDPETYFNYTDWDGNDIQYTDGGQKPPAYETRTVKIDGNGDKYVAMHYGAEGWVTYADMDAKWNSLSRSQKEAYFTDGVFDKQAFVTDHFGKPVVALGGDGKTPVPVKITDGEALVQDVINNSDIYDTINEYIGGVIGEDGRVVKGFTSGAKAVGTPGTDPNAGRFLSEINQFRYFDENGIERNEPLDSGKLQAIWKQFSDVFTPGRAMTTDEFKLRWNDGAGYIVGSDGVVKNFANKEFAEQYGGNANNGYRLRDNAFATMQFDKFVKAGISESNGALTWKGNIDPETAKMAVSGKLWEDASYSKYFVAGAGTKSLESIKMIQWVDGLGTANRWAPTRTIIDWVNANKNKLYPASNGRLYRVIGLVDPKENKSTAYVKLIDQATGAEVRYSMSSGGSKKMPFGTEGY